MRRFLYVRSCPNFFRKFLKKSSFSKNGESLNQHLEAVVQRCSVRKVFLEISQNSQENTCARKQVEAEA